MSQYKSDDWEYKYAKRFWDLIESRLTKKEKKNKDTILQEWADIFHNLEKNEATKEEITSVLYWLFNTEDGKWWITEGPMRSPHYFYRMKGLNTYFDIFLSKSNEGIGGIHSLKNGDKITEDEYNEYLLQYGKKISKHFISIGYNKNNDKVYEYMSDPESWKNNFFNEQTSTTE